MPSPFFSVVIPVYRTEVFLAECLGSLRAQTFADFECLVVDDGSLGVDQAGGLLTCTTVLGSTCLGDSRFRLLRQENRGQGFARQFGIDQASGRYLVLVDADDRLDADFLEIAHERLFQSAPNTLCFNQVAVFTPQGDRSFASTQRFVPAVNTLKSALVFPSYTLTPVNYFYDIARLREAGVAYRVGQAGEDTYFFFDYIHAWFEREGKLPLLREIPAVYRYRIDPAAASTTRDKAFDERLYRHHLAYFGTRLPDFYRWGGIYGLLARLFLWRQHLYLARLGATNPLSRFCLNISVKALTAGALLISGTRRG